MGSNFDILLIQAPYKGPYNFWKSESLGLGYLATALESEGYVVEILDAFLLELDIDEVVQRINTNPPNLCIGFSILSFELYLSTKEILSKLAKIGLDIHITVGSWFPTFWYKTMIREKMPINSVILAEGERSICALAEYLKTGVWGKNKNFLNKELIDDVIVLSQKETNLKTDFLTFP